MTGAGIRSGPARGFLNVNKERGITSTEVVRRVKRLTGAAKVGHGGTLDPLAEGVLPVCLGAATRFADTVLLGTKAYVLTVHLGTATDTFDSEGAVVSDSDASGVTADQVSAALTQFRGRIKQAPPIYSALKQDGMRLYDLARAGIEVHTQPREVEVHRVSLARWAWPKFDLDLECGHGFYARSLAHDLGAAMGTAAHMSGLCRTRAGKFRIEDASTLADLDAGVAAGTWRDLLFPVDWTLEHLRAVVLSERHEAQVRNGQPLAAGDLSESLAGSPEGEQVRAYGLDGELVAVLTAGPPGRGWRPTHVVPPA